MQSPGRQRARARALHQRIDIALHVLVQRGARGDDQRGQRDGCGGAQRGHLSGRQQQSGARGEDHQHQQARLGERQHIGQHVRGGARRAPGGFPRLDPRALGGGAAGQRET
jgi:hypothetical protein